MIPQHTYETRHFPGSWSPLRGNQLNVEYCLVWKGINVSHPPLELTSNQIRKLRELWGHDDTEGWCGRMIRQYRNKETGKTWMEVQMGATTLCATYELEP